MAVRRFRMVLAGVTGMTFIVWGLAGKCAYGSGRGTRACFVFANIPLAKAHRMAEDRVKKSGRRHCPE